MQSVFQWIENQPFSKIVRPLIVLAILLFSFFLGQHASTRIAILSYLAVGGVIATGLLIRRLDIGLMMLIPVAFLAKFELGTGTNIALNAAILLTAMLLGIWIFRMIAIDRAIRLHPSRVNAPAILFIFFTTLSLIIGNADWFIWAKEKASLPAQMGAWMLYTFPIGLLLLTGNSVRSLGDLQKLVWIFLILGSGYVLSRVPAQGFGPVINRYVYTSTGAMFWIWLATLAFGQLLYNSKLGRKQQFFLVLLIIGLFVTNWVYGRREWVSGWLPPLIALYVIIWLRSWKLGLIITFTGGLILVLAYPVIYSEVMTDTQQYSAYSRFATLSIMFELFKTSPLFGLGPANYRFYTPLFYLLGWRVQFNSHNNYVDILVQTGLLGMIFFLWLIIELAILTWRLRRRTDNGFVQGYLAATLGGLVGLLFSGFLGDWFLPYLYNIGIPGFRASLFAWLFLGGVVAIERINDQEDIVG